MRQNRNKRKYVIIGLCILLGVMTIGFSAFSTILNINGTAEITTSWDVEITNVETIEKVGDADNKEAPTFTYDTASLKASFKMPGDSIKYQITVSNLGSLNAVIDSAKLELDDQNVLIHKIEGIDAGEVLNAGASKSFTLTITFNEDITSQPDINGVVANLKLNYLQSGDSTPFTNAEDSTSDTITINSLDLTPSETSITAKINSTPDAYKYYYSLDEDVWYESSSDEYTINDLKPYTNYTVYVKAEDSGGEVVKYSKTVKTTDTTNPNLKIEKGNFVIDEKDKVNHINYEYYKGLELDVTATDNDQIESVKYCTSSEACTPNTNLTLTNGKGTVQMPSATGDQILCVTATDRKGNDTTKCSDKYKVDSDVPTLTDAKVTTVTDTVSIRLLDDNNNPYYNDAHSDVTFYYHLIETGVTDSPKNKEIEVSQDNYTFVGVEDGNYQVEIIVIDSSGNKSEAIYKGITVEVNNVCGNIITDLSECVIAKARNNTDVEAAKLSVKAKGTPDFTTVSPSIPYTMSKSSTTSQASASSYIYVTTREPSFNTTTGNYSISGGSTVDPETVDYSSNTYYTCGSTGTSCTTLFEIAKNNGIVTTTNATTGAKTYTITKYNYTAVAGTPDYTNDGMYEATDYDGNSTYYYRGAVTNNYVKFANKFWRIIRVNGDGTLRMIYDGTTAHDNGEKSNDRHIVKSNGTIDTRAFNSQWSDNAYVGYMYGDTSNNVITEATSPRTITGLNASYNYYFSDSYTYDPSTNYFTLTGNVIQDTVDGYRNNNRSDLYTCFSTTSPDNTNNKGKCTEVWKVKEYVSATSMKVEYEYTFNYTGLNSGTKYWFGTSYKYNGNNTFSIDGDEERMTLTEYQTANKNNMYTCLSATSDNNGKPNGACQRLLKVRKINTATSAQVRPVEYSSTSYASAHTNTVPSTMKTYLENTWYPSNLAAHTNKLSGSSVFCNNREILNYTQNTYTNEGYGTHPTMYGYPRFWGGYGLSRISPSLSCPRSDDRFTVDSSKGNGLQSAPVGLITADEVSMAGGRTGMQNPRYYLYTGNVYWTMSPSIFNGNANARELSVTESGVLAYSDVGAGYGVRPVINLNTENLSFSGSGTMSNPYVVP